MTNEATGVLAPRALTRPEHTLSRKDLSNGALRVLYRLHRAGYLAYLVGGGVRDLLLGRRPKDFDVVTNARPEEIRRLFRNSRIIGRRFRLVHVFFRDETVEVATFRSNSEAPEGPEEWAEATEEAVEEVAEEAESRGRRRLPPLDDEVFGTPAEDARRRDFTVNGLFYDIADFSIIDHVGGLDDLEGRLIRTIGPPVVRFEEDPVRMLRALEYAVRLDFEIEPATRAAIEECVELLGEASPARLTYELSEGLHSGAASGIVREWCRFGVLGRAFPHLPFDEAVTQRLLAEVDRRRQQEQPVSPVTVLGAFFLPQAARVLAELFQDGRRFDNPSYLERLNEMLSPAGAAMHLTNHQQHLLHHGLFTLSKLRRAPERGRQVVKLARQDYFAVAWEMFELAAASGLVPEAPWQAWSRALERLRRGEEAVAQAAPTEDLGRRGRRPRLRRKR